MGVPEVVLVTPNEVDARVALSFLGDAGIASRACTTLGEFCARPLADVACAVLVEEALVQEEVTRFLAVLAAQPTWSDLPLIVVASPGAALGVLVGSVFPESGNVVVLERPLNPVSLVSTVKMGLRARHRQFEVRDLLQHRERALRYRDEFLAMLAHELRNPLAPLRNAAYVMQHLPLSEPLSRVRDLIDRQTAHLKRLVDDLLEVSRLELGKVNLEPHPLDLNTVIAASTEVLRPLTTACCHTMEVRLAPEPLIIMGDPVRIEQIVGNLIANAAKFTPNGGRIVVEGIGDETTATISVHDTGIGIRADMLTSVFDLFTQDEQTLERAAGGLGIGLTIVKRLAELHGGTASVVSAGPGLGSTFSVRFSRVTLAAEPAATTQSGLPSRLPRKRGLVVDDNADILESLGLILEMWGQQVAFASTGREALEHARELKPDVALIDIGLPELNAYEVARAIRAAGTSWSNDVALIALTGYGRNSDREHALNAGFDLHLVKPVDLDALAQALTGRVGGS